ncbi:MAG: ABC transporter permease [Ktedonobacteraceae bacterium]
MNALFSVLLASFRAEILQLVRARLFLALTIVQAVTFLFLVSLFGMTGSRAPTAILDEDHGPYAKAFISQLVAAHHSFDLRPMDEASALDALHRGSLVAIITIPKDFSYAIAHEKETTIHVSVDNVNTDMTADIERALPSAIVAFGKQHRLPGIRLQAIEVDLINHDTGFIPYLVVSGLALDAFIIASILSAMAVAREFETGTIKFLAVAPVHPLLSLLGRMLATDLIASAAMVLPVALAVFGYGISPLHPLEMMGVMLLCIAIFGCIGVAIGTVLRQTLPVVSLVFGLGFPFYLCSGSLEPQRFDGNLIWALAHVSPVYYAVGLLEQAFHGLQVTPETSWVNFVALLGWAVLMLLLAGILLRTALIAKTTTRQKASQRRTVVSWNWRWQKPRLVLPGANWLFAVLILFAIGGGIWFQEQQHHAEVRLRQQQQSEALAATEEQRETRLLSDYETKISSLLSHDRLLSKQITNPTKDAASRLTRKTLPQLDPTHKGALLHFLYSSRLIDDESYIVNLHGADLRAGKFAGLNLSDSILTGADFRGADLHGVNLRSATLNGVNFSGANLAGADLRGAELHNVDVSKANLTGANLAGTVGMSVEQLIVAASLSRTTLPDGSVQSTAEEDSD